ncbi:MAG: 4Fe-4S dicluster domain-containing protein [Desulfovibrionaceae bacterium]
MQKAFFIDTSRCTACRGCQVACKQWHKLPAEPTKNVGSYQNPQDLSFHTYKLVRFSEDETGGGMRWLFFPEQCRHCLVPPCKQTADNPDAILQDETTGAVIFTELTAKEDKDAIRDSCPYDIPRTDPVSGIMGKCDMCLDRVHNGLKPACVLSCPTGAMNFGDRDEMLALAKTRLAKVKKRSPQAMLADPDDVSVIYLFEVDPKRYHTHAVAEAAPVRGMTRKDFLAALARPVKHLG